MPHNPILDEIRAVRESMLAAAGGTTAGLVKMLQEQERQSGRQVLNERELPRNRRARQPRRSLKHDVAN